MCFEVGGIDRDGLVIGSLLGLVSDEEMLIAVDAELIADPEGDA
jgi:hypothetical protein